MEPLIKSVAYAIPQSGSILVTKKIQMTNTDCELEPVWRKGPGSQRNLSDTGNGKKRGESPSPMQMASLRHLRGAVGDGNERGYTR